MAELRRGLILTGTLYGIECFETDNLFYLSTRIKDTAEILVTSQNADVVLSLDGNVLAASALHAVYIIASSSKCLTSLESLHLDELKEANILRYFSLLRQDLVPLSSTDLEKIRDLWKERVADKKVQTFTGRITKHTRIRPLWRYLMIVESLDKKQTLRFLTRDDDKQFTGPQVWYYYTQHGVRILIGMRYIDPPPKPESPSDIEMDFLEHVSSSEED